MKGKNEQTTAEFSDTRVALSASLTNIVAKVPQTGGITIRDLIPMFGEQGLLLIAMFMGLPFLLPVSIPGVSTIFGLVILLIGIGVALNRLPWLPERVLRREIEGEQIHNILRGSLKFVSRVERAIRPRLLNLTESGALNRLHGLSIAFSAILLMVPLGLVPFSNTLPAAAIIFLCAGLLQRDGLFILLGYAMIIATLVYFGAITVATIVAGGSLLGLLRGG